MDDAYVRVSVSVETTATGPHAVACINANVKDNKRRSNGRRTEGEEGKESNAFAGVGEDGSAVFLVFRLRSPAFVSLPLSTSTRASDVEVTQ